MSDMFIILILCMFASWTSLSKRCLLLSACSQSPSTGYWWPVLFLIISDHCSDSSVPPDLWAINTRTALSTLHTISKRSVESTASPQEYWKERTGMYDWCMKTFGRMSKMPFFRSVKVNDTRSCQALKMNGHVVVP